MSEEVTESTSPSKLLPLRLGLGTAGVLLGGYGAFRILSEPKTTQPFELLHWLIGAVIIHDGLVVPATLLSGLVLTRVVPARARRYLQGTLVAIAVLIPPVLLEIYRHGSQPGQKALDNQNYAAHLALVAAVIATFGVLGYLIRRYRDRRMTTSDEDSSSV